MTKRSVDWNEGLAEDLRDPAFAREFILAAVEEGVAVQEALGKMIRAMGVADQAASSSATASSSGRTFAQSSQEISLS